MVHGTHGGAFMVHGTHGVHTTYVWYYGGIKDHQL
jgi:hypothetical protein